MSKFILQKLIVVKAITLIIFRFIKMEMELIQLIVILVEEKEQSMEMELVLKKRQVEEGVVVVDLVDLVTEHRGIMHSLNLNNFGRFSSEDSH